KLATTPTATETTTMAKRPTNPTKRSTAKSTSKPTSDPHAAHREALHEQVRQLLDLETLADRKRDSLDFHEVGVSDIRAIIALAFDAGLNAASGKPAPVLSTDPAAIIASMHISKRDGRPTGGNWVSGTIAGHSFEALVFAEHAESSSYELGNSRISKLHLTHQITKRTAAAFDRGWEVTPTSELAKAIVDVLASGLAETVFGK
ncbi:MAG TPA: hypothetical protein VK157_12495, partial [Phycisphaerales bacterium]|nr:hypothetical protein [Phycisphaerales bacterium]